MRAYNIGDLILVRTGIIPLRTAVAHVLEVNAGVPTRAERWVDKSKRWMKAQKLEPADLMGEAQDDKRTRRARLSLDARA